MIDPLYSKNSTLPSAYRKKISSKQKVSSIGVECVQQVSTFKEFQKDVVPLVCTLGPMLHKDPVLLGKIVRLCKVIVNSFY